MKTTLSTLLTLAAASPILLADINANVPVTPTPQTPARAMGNCDLLASNTVRATFLGVRALQMQSFDQAAPATVHVAVFQVIDNLAYKRYVRYGDGALKPGSCFTVAMSRDLPGQPANVADTIAQMQVGEEAVLKIDHLYIFGDQEGKPLRPCSRMARRQAAVAQPTPVQTTPSPTAVPSATAPAPASPTPQPVQTEPDKYGDDTTVEHAPQNATPQPIIPPAASPTGSSIGAGDSF